MHKTAGGEVNQYLNYDERGNPGTVILGAGTPEQRTVTYTYHPVIDAPLTRTEPSVLTTGNKVTIWDYDSDYNDIANENPSSLLTRIIEQGYTKNTTGTIVPYEFITTFTYNPKGQVLTVDGPIEGTSDVTEFTYDPANGNLVSITRPLVGTTALGDYDNAGRAGRITDVNGQSEALQYDGKGNVLSVTHEADGSAISNTYNLSGLIESNVDEDGVTRTFEYDPVSGLLSRLLDRDGNYISYVYDARGNRIEMSKYSSSGLRTNIKRWNFEYPYIPGKLWKVTRSDGSFIEYGYNNNGYVSSIIDYEGNRTDYSYDSLNRLISITQPNDAMTMYSYDGHGNLASITDANGNLTNNSYDDMGRVLSTTSPDTGTATYAYDSSGNLIKKTDARGITAQYAYDLLNRITAIHFPDPAEDIAFTYDEGLFGIGRRTGMTDPSGHTSFGYDARGRLVEKTAEVNAVSYPLSRTYTHGGRLSSITYPSGRNIDYARYANGKIRSLSTTFNLNSTVLVDNLVYMPFGKPTGMTTGSGGIVNNQSSECDCLEVANPGKPMEQIYTYDRNKNLISIRGTYRPQYDRDFAYDSLNRLVTGSGLYGTIGFTYDDVGNRLTKTFNGETETYSYIAGTNRLSGISGSDPVSFTYDENGNVIGTSSRTFTYNQANRLVRVNESGNTLGEYTYNGIGQRIKKSTDEGTTIFHYDFDGNIIGKSSPGGSFNTEFLYLGSSRTAKVDAATGAIFHYLNDYLGTPQVMTDANGIVVWKAHYRPFGQAVMNIHSSVENNFRFAGQYYDQETGLHYNYWRYYDPTTGRYLTPDPIGLDGGINLYAYVQNNPVNFVDFFGLKMISKISVNQTKSTVVVNYQDGTSASFPAATGDGVSFPGADANATGTVKSSAWGPVGPYLNTQQSWSLKNDANPYGPAIILLKGTNGRHIHGTNGPMTNSLDYIGGTNPTDRQFTHGCARVTNQTIVELKEDVDETLSAGKKIPVEFRH